MKTNRLQTFLVRRRLNEDQDAYFLNDAEFRLAADCERMRVDRNGSVLSLLLIRLAPKHSTDKDLALLARTLEGRLRITDTSGVLADGRIGVLLPDTPTEGAWKVATDISEVYPPGPGRPECEVLVYPYGDWLLDQTESEQEAEEQPSAGTSSPVGDGNSFFHRSSPAWKRAIDILGSTFGLALAAPLIGGAALGVKLSSPGPVFFKQQREGLGGKVFTIYKLRTMVKDAEQLQEDLRDDSHQDGPAFKMKGDPRTTWIGKVLRYTSIDELPQLWNVLRGEMSLVGPRPLPTEESLACTNWQRRRLAVRPGMTCIWQVKGRGAVTFDEWMRMDLAYVENRNLWTDCKLLVTTFPSLIVGKGIR